VLHSAVNPPKTAIPHGMQDAMDRGFFKQKEELGFGGSRELVPRMTTGPDMTAISWTAYEIACGMAHLHSRNVVHGGELATCTPSVRLISRAAYMCNSHAHSSRAVRSRQPPLPRQRHEVWNGASRRCMLSDVETCKRAAEPAVYVVIHTCLSTSLKPFRHADLKGGNILLKTAQTQRGYQAKIADFGTARALGPQQRVQSEKYGTVTHCPPELLCEGTFSKVGRHLPFPPNA
jgi:serine/threonine protein kinase